MKPIRILIAGIAVSGLCATQAAAQSSIAAGLASPQPETVLTKVQFRLPFGMSSKKVRRILGRDGFDEIEITYLGILDAKADACLKGIRYRVKLRANGTYEYRNEIGKCRAVVKLDDVRGIIRKEGFRDIDVQNDGKVPYIANACRRGERFDIEVSEYGDVKVGRSRGQGRCGRGRNRISPQDLRAALRKDGYNRIKFTDRTPRRFIVEACRENRRVRLEINRRGRVRDRDRIGRCATAIRVRDLPALLEKDGFDRVDVVDDTPPRYRVEACRKNDRIRVAINAWGEQIDEKKIGECEPPATIASLTEKLRANARNFKGVSVRKGRRYAFVADVCDEGLRRELYFSRHGKFEGKKDTGRCTSPRISEVLERLSDRGFRKAEVIVEACRRSGRRVRVKFDEYGNELGRERIGRC